MLPASLLPGRFLLGLRGLRRVGPMPPAKSADTTAESASALPRGVSARTESVRWASSVRSLVPLLRLSLVLERSEIPSRLPPEFELVLSESMRGLVVTLRFIDTILLPLTSDARRTRISGRKEGARSSPPRTWPSAACLRSSERMLRAYLAMKSSCISTVSTATQKPTKPMTPPASSSRRATIICTESRTEMVTWAEKTIVSTISSVSLMCCRRSTAPPSPPPRPPSPLRVPLRGFVQRLTASWTMVTVKRSAATRVMRVTLTTKKVPPIDSIWSRWPSPKACTRHSGAVISPTLTMSSASESISRSVDLGQPSCSSPTIESVCAWHTKIAAVLIQSSIAVWCCSTM